MKAVELIPGGRTVEWALARRLALGERIGHFAASATDTPGFLVNHAGQGCGTETLRILGEGSAGSDTADCIRRDSVGFRMRPPALLAQVGSDNILRILVRMYDFSGDPRYRPSPWLKRRTRLGVPLTTPEQ
ncbi:3-hydroxyacyl-CoA dehydrogenase family protein [Alkalilimnicola ehrlichii]|nr:3-hydroxyacyl-CoA dehydrogenase family protein [Alkalilimnicola ehrlichii]